MAANGPEECQGKDMTLYVSSDKDRAVVEIIPGQLTELSTGSHVIHRDGCAINVHVINNGMLGDNQVTY